jgi:hypothetical protein
MGACGAWPRGTLPVSASLPPAAITWATSCSAFGSAEAAARWPFELAGVDGGLDPRCRGRAAAATGRADLKGPQTTIPTVEGCPGPFVATTRCPSPQPPTQRPADGLRVGSRFHGTVAVTAPTG